MMSRQQFSKVQALRIVAVAVLLGAIMRLYRLGTPFASSDNAGLAIQIICNQGWAWMFYTAYGPLINFITKIWAVFMTASGIGLDEFVWRLPVALVGVASIPMAYAFLRSISVSRKGAAAGALVMAVFPLHVFQSRYLWGYEVLGFFFLMLALISLRWYLRSPSLWRGLACSTAFAAYLCSHGYFMPVVLVVAWYLLLFTQDTLAALKDLVRHFVWIMPVLAYPFFISSIYHALNKNARFGLFMFAYLDEFGTAFGAAMTLLIGVALAAVIARVVARKEVRPALFLLGAAGVYLLPLFLTGPPGVTVIRGYMLIGGCFLILLAGWHADTTGRWWFAVLAAALIVTSLGTLAAMGHDDAQPEEMRRIGQYSLITSGRGGFEDTGVKALGYLLYRYGVQDAEVLAVHRHLEAPVMRYYIGRRNLSWTDLTHLEWRTKLTYYGHESDLMLCDDQQMWECRGVAAVRSGYVYLRVEGQGFGDLHAFFFNTSGYHVPDMVDFLRRNGVRCSVDGRCVMDAAVRSELNARYDDDYRLFLGNRARISCPASYMGLVPQAAAGMSRYVR
ncbi:MAG: hypothetical protein ACOCWQ_01930 [Nanoarchaeota archaeon]